jgi:hypothetical protein
VTTPTARNRRQVSEAAAAPELHKFSRSSLQVFSELLAGYALPATHPSFAQVARAISVANSELAAALTEAGSLVNTDA